MWLDQTNRREARSKKKNKNKKLATKQRRSHHPFLGKNQKQWKRKKKILHLIDLHGPFLDGNVFFPSRKVLGAQRLDEMVHDYLRALVVLGHLHLRHSSARHAPTNVGEVCGIHDPLPGPRGGGRNQKQSARVLLHDQHSLGNVKHPQNPPVRDH